MKKNLSIISLLTVAILSLPSCAPLLIGGAVIGGVALVSDPRSSGSQLEDKAIYTKATNKISRDFKNKVDVSVTSYDRHVLLTGFVPSEQHKQDIEKAVSSIQGVDNVYNELEVGNSISLWRKAQDTSLTGRIRAALLTANHLPSNSFKVTSNNSTAYLMGLSLPENKQLAVDTVSKVRGVKEVVSYIRILEN